MGSDAVIRSELSFEAFARWVQAAMAMAMALINWSGLCAKCSAKQMAALEAVFETVPKVEFDQTPNLNAEAEHNQL